MKYTFSNREKVLVTLLKFLVLITGAVGLLAYSIFKKSTIQTLQKPSMLQVTNKKLAT